MRRQSPPSHLLLSNQFFVGGQWPRRERLANQPGHSQQRGLRSAQQSVEGSLALGADGLRVVVQLGRVRRVAGGRLGEGDTFSRRRLGIYRLLPIPIVCGVYGIQKVVGGASYIAQTSCNSIAIIAIVWAMKMRRGKKGMMLSCTKALKSTNIL